MKLFVWDFHGVLEQGNEHAAIAVSNQILKEFGYSERFSEMDAFRLYGQKWYQYFEDLLPHEHYDRHMQLRRLVMTIPSTKPSYESTFARISMRPVSCGRLQNNTIRF